MKTTPIAIVIPTKNITSEGLELWMQVRKEEGPLDGFLEFPGGKIEANERPSFTASREFLEEVGVKLNEKELKHFKIETFDYTDRKVALYIYFIKLDSLNAASGEWFSFDYESKSKKYSSKILEANYSFIDTYLEYMKENFDNNLMELVWAK